MLETKSPSLNLSNGLFNPFIFLASGLSKATSIFYAKAKDHMQIEEDLGES